MYARKDDITEHPCFKIQFNCEFEIKSYNTTQLCITEFKLLMSKTANCVILASGVTTRIAKAINKAYFISYNFSGVIVFSDGTSIPSQILKLDYTIKYTEPAVHRLHQKLKEYKANDWTDYDKLKKLETGLVKQVIARYV